MRPPLDDLLSRPDVRAAREWLEAHDEETLDRQVELTCIPAPTGGEAARAAYVLDWFRRLALAEACGDEAGNVLARYGEGPGAGVAIAAHLDTVFPDREIRPRVTGTRIAAPGIGDNGRGLAALLSLAEACVECGLRVPGPVWFVGTVGEEGEGNLRGVTHLFDGGAFRPEAFIALDGPGLDRIVNRGTASVRLRLTFAGPGGHSWSAFGVANPAHAAGAAAAAIGELALPPGPRATASVVRLGGGSGLNTIPGEAWLDVDLRAEEQAALDALERGVLAASGRARDSANRRRAAGTRPLDLRVETLGRRPGGRTSESHPLVRAALDATRALGVEPHLAAASTDANVPIGLGVPAVALGAGGRGGDAHLPSEWYENVDGPAGIVRALLLVLAAGCSPAGEPVTAAADA